MNDSLMIGEVSKRSGLGVETVRFYEREGLIEKPPRRSSGYRAYPANVVPRLGFIRHAKELGFTLKEIRELLSLRARDGRPRVRRARRLDFPDLQAQPPRCAPAGQPPHISLGWAFLSAALEIGSGRTRPETRPPKAPHAARKISRERWRWVAADRSELQPIAVDRT